ncbi:MAG: proline--tRNA ligase, partial [Spirochaetales bacterium]
TVRIDTKEAFYDFFQSGDGGFALTHWNGSEAVEEQVKADLSVTIRAIPLDSDDDEPGICPFTGEPSTKRVVFARNY